MAREIAVTFSLNAALSSGFTGAFKSAVTSAREVASAVRDMEKSPTGKIGAAMVAQREKIKGLSGSLKEAQATLAGLQARAQAAGGATGLLATQINQAERRVSNLSGALTRQLGQWRETAAQAATVGGSVRNLARDYEQLSARMDRARGLAGAIGANRARGEALRQQRADLQGRLLSTATTTATVALPVKLAISAEDTFADLRKVMDAPEDVMQQVFADAQEMSARTGKSFEDVVAIMTAAAQAGLGKTREELLGVADQAVKMSIAWGVSAEAAGKSMATWQAAMGLTSEQAKHTGDVINALSNSMNAEAGEINAIFTRLGPLMKGSGMATDDIAALATAFKAAGAEVEVSGTAMKNFIKAMAAGSAGLTDEKAGIYQYLKIDPDELQKQLYTDSKGAILRVLEALKNVRPEERNSISSKLFGEESIAAISPLIEQLGTLREAYKIANSDVAGSVDEEYANRMKTTATAIGQMTQSVRNLGVNAGKTLLPAVSFVARGIGELASIINGLVQRFPRLSSAIMIAGAAFAALAVGTLFFGLLINTVRTGVNGIAGLFFRMAASQVAATASTGALAGATGAFGVASTAAGAGARIFAGGLRAILTATGVGAVLVALGFAVSLLIDHWDEVVAAMSSAWNWVKTTWGQLGVFFTELGNNLAAIFPALGVIISNPFVWAKEAVVAVWTGVSEFFSGLWNGIASTASGIWQGVVGIVSWARDSIVGAWTGISEWISAVWQGIVDNAGWAFEGVAAIWNGAAEFFSGIVNGFFGIFAGFFDWLKEKFAWVFSTIDTVSSVVGSITGAVKGAWNKAFGDKKEGGEAAKGSAPAAAAASDKPAAPAASASVEKPVAATAGATPKAPSVAPIAQSAPPAPGTVAPQAPQGSYSDFIKNKEEAKKAGKGKKTGGGRAGGGGSRAAGGVARATGGAGSGPTTIVKVGGDNKTTQTIFIPAGNTGVAGSQSGKSAPIAASAGAGSVAGKAAGSMAVSKAGTGGMALPQTPGMIAGKQGGKQKSAQSPSSIQVDLTQNFDLISGDAAAMRKVMESLKPDFEALVRKALAKMQSDHTRTAYAQ